MTDTAHIGMTNRTARREDFKRLSRAQQDKIAALLRSCADLRLSVRVEALGDDIYVLVGRGFSSPRYWLENFGLIGAAEP